MQSALTSETTTQLASVLPLPIRKAPVLLAADESHWYVDE
jgi:hypothetical protein